MLNITIWSSRVFESVDKTFWSFFQILYLNEKKRPRNAISSLLSIRRRAPSVMGSGAEIMKYNKRIE